MKKKLLNAIPYILGLLYLLCCLFNVEAWVKSHTEEYLFFVALAWFASVILAVIFIVLKLIRKRELNMYLPIFFFLIGLTIYIVARSIPCCTGS